MNRLNTLRDKLVVAAWAGDSRQTRAIMRGIDRLSGDSHKPFVIRQDGLFYCQRGMIWGRGETVADAVADYHVRLEVFQGAANDD